VKARSLSVHLALAAFFALPAAAQQAAAPPPAAATLIRNVRIFDGKSAQLSGPSHVLVRGNRIERISATPIAADGGAGTVVIEGGGRTKTRIVSCPQRAADVKADTGYRPDFRPRDGRVRWCGCRSCVDRALSRCTSWPPLFGNRSEVIRGLSPWQLVDRATSPIYWAVNHGR
jgi:hypothetical protein